MISLCACRRRLQEPKLLPQEEVTYAEPVLVTPSSKPMGTSPKATLRKQDNNLFSHFQNSENYYPPVATHPANRPRDHFGTLRSQRDFARVSIVKMFSWFRNIGHNGTPNFAVYFSDLEWLKPAKFRKKDQTFFSARIMFCDLTSLNQPENRW